MDEAQATLQTGDAVAHQVNSERINHLFIEHAQIAGVFCNARDDLRGREAAVVDAGLDEFLEPHQIQLISRHAGYQ